jgi:hypothetical protein
VLKGCHTSGICDVLSRSVGRLRRKALLVVTSLLGAVEGQGNLVESSGVKSNGVCEVFLVGGGYKLQVSISYTPERRSYLCASVIYVLRSRLVSSNFD